MAEGVLSFPLPPQQYVQLHSDENIKRGRNPKPPPPLRDSYTMFGIPFHADDQIIQPLENQGFRRLYPHHYDHKRELKKLNHSILTSFLDLIDILIRSPESIRRREKIDDLTLLFIHMHHLINEFRPHQARETLRVMLEAQCKQRRNTAERFHKHLDKVREMVTKSIETLPDDDALDSKLTIKLEPMEEKNGESKIKEEPFDDTRDECSAVDKMMCDIVDSL